MHLLKAKRGYPRISGLNLKLLLASSREVLAFQPTAVGACALHANDYIESEDPSRLQSGLLPVVAEFAATWEINNGRGVGCSVESRLAPSRMQPVLLGPHRLHSATDKLFYENPTLGPLRVHKDADGLYAEGKLGVARVERELSSCWAAVRGMWRNR